VLLVHVRDSLSRLKATKQNVCSIGEDVLVERRVHVIVEIPRHKRTWVAT